MARQATFGIKSLTPAELKAAREALGLSLSGLAKALRMGKTGRDTIRAWESDDNVRGVPGPAQIAVEHLLKCTPSRSIPGMTKSPKSPKAENVNAGNDLEVKSDD